MDPTSPVLVFLSIVDIIVAVIFTIEMVLKMAAYGLYDTDSDTSYFRDGTQGNCAHSYAYSFACYSAYCSLTHLHTPLHTPLHTLLLTPLHTLPLTPVHLLPSGSFSCNLTARKYRSIVQISTREATIQILQSTIPFIHDSFTLLRIDKL